MPGFKPEKYRCEIPECDGIDPEFEFYDGIFFMESTDKSIFVQDGNGVNDYCKMYPLQKPFNKDDKGGKCTLSSFNLSGTPIECNAEVSKVIHEQFLMETSIVTDFNLFCNEEYKVIDFGSKSINDLC